MNNRPKFNISDILNKAESENEKLRSVNYTPAEKAMPKAQDEETPVCEQKPDSVPATETDALIGKYSKKQRIVDDKTSTDSLRRTLGQQMENDKELLRFYHAAGTKSRKVEELYNLINYATASDETDRKAIDTPVPDARAAHFTDSADIDDGSAYRQQKFYEFDRTAVIPDVKEEPGEFDKEYDNLSQKIESGELDFTEEPDDDQVAMIEDEVAVAAVSPESADPAEPDDEKDRNLRMAFDMLDEKDTAEADTSETKKRREKPAKAKKAEKKPEAPAYEYVDRSQNGEIQELLTKAIRSSLAKFVFTLLLAAVIFAFELFGDKIPLEYIRPGRYGRLYTLIDLQLLCFGAITMLDSLKKGVKGLFTGKACSDSVLAASFAFAAVHCVVTLFFFPEATRGLYCLPAAVMFAVCAFMKWLQCRKDYHCFKVIASTRTKYVAEKVTGNTREAEEFYKYLFDRSDIYTTRKTDFVNGFFRRVHERPESESVNSFIVWLALGVSAALFGVSLYMKSGFYEAFTRFIQCLAFALPFASFSMIALPVVAANRIGKKNGSAFIGNAVGEEYDNASVISFADTEVYPANLVKITSVNVFGSNRIDLVADELATLFSFVGGPLKSVTENIISGDVRAPASAKLIESASDGIYVILNSHHMFVGKRNYLRRYRFQAPYDENDAKFERRNGSVMYITRDDELVAKVYVRYTLNPQFNTLLRDLYRAGMCVGIKTTDPNITNELIEKSVKYKRTPISILKAGDINDVEAHCETADSGIVVNASLHTFLKMFIVCDKIRHVTKANAIITMLSICIAFFVSFFLAFTGQMAETASWYPVIYQLLWLVPVSVVSFLL